MDSYSPKQKDISPNWLIIDAADQVLGRIATQASVFLRGKHKATYAAHMDMGDYVIVINSDKVRVTGNKRTDKIYYHHTGFIGGIKQISFKDLMKKDSTEIIKKAVFGMMPKNALCKSLRSKLKVYKTSEHPHIAQSPTKYN